MRFKEYASKKVVAIITAIMLIFGGIFIQHNKIKNLEHFIVVMLYMKKLNETIQHKKIL